jgi:hypothetical protein
LQLNKSAQNHFFKELSDKQIVYSHAEL